MYLQRKAKTKKKKEKSWRKKLNVRVSDISTASRNHFSSPNKCHTHYNLCREEENHPLNQGPASCISFIFHPTLLTYPHFTSYSSDNCREHIACTGSKCTSCNHVTRFPHQYTSQRVEDHFLDFLIESL